MKFNGTFKELSEGLSRFLAIDKWEQMGENLYRYKYHNVIISWFPDTGKINIEGKFRESRKVIIQIQNALTASTDKGQPNNPLTDQKLENDEYDLFKKYSDSEVIIGIVCAVGTEHKIVTDIIKDRLAAFNYQSDEIHISKDVIPQLFKPKESPKKPEYERIKELIELGNKARESSKDNTILALGAASEILRRRELDESGQVKPKKRIAFIVNSLKHPDEVERLREIYSCGFFLIGISSSDERRKSFLIESKMMNETEAEELIRRDADEILGHGQHTRDAFQLADFFIDLDNDLDKVKKSIWRILDLIFGNPYLTPTFDEFAMFMAFTSSLRSADLSRQVGAVIAKENEIIAMGANDCPKAGGGLYWPIYDTRTKEIKDIDSGRDYTRSGDSNKFEQNKIIQEIIDSLELSIQESVKEKLTKSRIKDLTEFGRVVHAEMEAILMCSRNNVSTRGTTIYCTTFPCHNCAKHIIAAGIKRVVYVEPYPKSKAFEFHADSICKEVSPATDLVEFIPFVGVGPRRFFELFSISLGSGYKIQRKDKTGKTINWRREKGRLRTQLFPYSYLDKETYATEKFNEKRGETSG